MAKHPTALDYASPANQSAAPSGLRILVGLFIFSLGIFPLAVCVMFAWVAAAALFRFIPFAGDEPLPRVSALAFAPMAWFCIFAARVMFKMARRMFKAKKRPDFVPPAPSPAEDVVRP